MNLKRTEVAVSLLVIGLLMPGCAPSVQSTPTATLIPATETAIPTHTLTPTPKPTDTLTPVPTDTPTLIPPLSEWNEIPIPPEAITGEEVMGDYQFTTKASATDIATYYNREMVKRGWILRTDMMTKVPGTALAFIKGNTYVFFMISSQGDTNVVYIHIVQM